MCNNSAHGNAGDPGRRRPANTCAGNTNADCGSPNSDSNGNARGEHNTYGDSRWPWQRR